MLNESYNHSYTYTTATYVNAVQIITIYAYGMDSRTVRVRYIPYAYSYTVRVYVYGMYHTRMVRYTHAVQNTTNVLIHTFEVDSIIVNFKVWLLNLITIIAPIFKCIT